MIVRKAFKYRMYPNREQQEKLAVLKASEETSWLGEAHSQVLQQSLKNLDRAFQNFFEKRSGDPQFKSKRARQSIRYPHPKQNWIASEGRHLYLPKVGYVRMVMHRVLEGEMKNVTVSRTQSGKYFISIQVEVEIARPVLTGGGAVGPDLGLRDFATLSTGEKIAPPQHYRKKPGSSNREQARLRLARLDERIANQHRDFHHKVSRLLVEENQFIGLEDLNIKGMQGEVQLRTSSSGKIHG